MRTALRLAVAALAFSAVLPACTRGSCMDMFASAPPSAVTGGAPKADAPGAQGGSANAGATPTTPADAQRAISEADIVQVDQGRLYAMSKSGTLAIVDVSKPGSLTLLGRATLAGVPFEMYRRGDTLFTMSNSAINVDGSTRPLTVEGEAAAPVDPNAGSVVTALDVHDPQNVRVIGSLPVPGEIADSRIVGDVLYLATYENTSCLGCGKKPRTMVTTFNIATPSGMREVDHASFESNAPDNENLAWGMAWKRSIVATSGRLYIGGHADVGTTQSGDTGKAEEGIIDVLDITDPSGRLSRGAHITIAGAVLSRWQVDEDHGVLRVISQRGVGRTGNGIGSPEVATFRIESTSSFVPLGKTSLTLPSQEGLRTVRFDGKRAYAITFDQTDPLFTIDLSDPAKPVQKGELHMPGWMFHLEPHGDRVIGLGIDRTDPNGSLNVSLFDVADLSSPALLKRVSFGATDLGEDYEILGSELPEDQDRIQKAFRVFADGLVVVPFSATSRSATDQCQATGGGVQLVEWSNNTLVKRALLPLVGNPRRAMELDAQLLTVSDSNVRSFSLAERSVAKQTADLVIAKCVPRDTTYGGGGGLGHDVGDYYGTHPDDSVAYRGGALGTSGQCY